MFSVLLSVYEKENPAFLEISLESIWDNQELKPSEIVVVKDGKLTASLDKVLEVWKDRLGDVFVVVPLPVNVGLALALNEGLKHCNYDIVARMDTDDFSEKCRFKNQVAFLETNPSVAVCSGQIEEWDSLLKHKVSDRNLPTNHDDIVKFCKFRCPISHPAVAFRKSAVLASGGYPNVYPEDYPLWGKMLNEGYIFANLAEVILRMRGGGGLLRRRGWAFLKGEVRVYLMFYKMGFISLPRLLFNIVCRSGLRLSPNFLKYAFYRFLR